MLIVITTITYAQIPNNIPTQDLVAWYPFNGNSADSSVNSNHLINNGATLTTDRNGVVNSAFVYDGVNDYMTCNSPSFQFGETSSFTISFWSYRSSTSSGWAFNSGYTQGDGGSGKFCQFFSFNTPPAAQWRTNKQSTAWQIAQANNHVINVWENWVCVYVNKNMTVYRNGVLAATATYTSSGAVTATMPFRLGVNLLSNGSFFTGKLDDYGIWTRALTVNEITNLYSPCTPVTGGTMTVSSCENYVSPSGITYTATGIYSDTLQTIGGCDSIVSLDLTILESTSSNITVSSCFEYISPAGNPVTMSGVYQEVIPNAAGCDSNITINLTINTVNIATTVSGVTISATASDNYQWLNCDNAYSEVTGETSQDFTATFNGNFAVELTQNGCVDTSACTPITNVSINENILSSEVYIYPNPNEGIVYIELNELKDVSIKVINASGKLVYFKNNINSKHHQFELNEAAGVYSVEVFSGEKTMRFKLVVL